MGEKVFMRDKRTGATRLVDVDYAVCHVIARGPVPIAGYEARRRLLEGERFDTAQAQFYRRSDAAVA